MVIFKIFSFDVDLFLDATIACRDTLSLGHGTESLPNQIKMLKSQHLLNQFKRYSEKQKESFGYWII